MEVDQPPVDAPMPAESCFRVEYHPASGLEPKIIPLDGPDQNCRDETVYTGPDPPWAPFPTRADFDFADFVTTNNLSDAVTNDLLRRMREHWASDVHITASSANEVNKNLDQAANPFSTVNIPLLDELFAKYLNMQ